MIALYITGGVVLFVVSALFAISWIVNKEAREQQQQMKDDYPFDM